VLEITPPTSDPSAPDGSLDQVRRSIENLIVGFVFARNDGNTWQAVEVTLSTYLRQLWREGMLGGDSAREAFAVRVGVGSTMSEQDVADGYLVVQVTLQLGRPAEFVELEFRQLIGQ
jgi:hypothetical protein